MADASRIIEFVFSGVDKTSSAIDAITGGMDQLAGGVQDVTQPLADATFALLKFETAVAATALAVAGFAVNEAGKFDASMRELATLINGGEAEAEQFSVAIQKMGQTSVVSLEDLTGAMYKAVSQTGSLEGAQQAVAAAEKLAVAGRADLTDTTLLLVGTLASYGKGMDEAAHFSDVLFSVVQNGQTTLPELAAGLGQVAPSAAGLGVSIEDLGAAIALLTKSGIGTSEAMTGIKQALSNVAAPSKEAEDTAKSLGIEFSATALASKGLAGFLADLVEKTGGSKEALIALFGSVEARNTVFVLARDNGQAFADSLDAIKTGAGSTERAYALMVDTFIARNQQIINNLKLVGIAFGSELLEPVGNVQNALTALLQSLANSIEAGAFDPLFQAAESALNRLAATIARIAEIFPQATKGLDFSGLLSALRELSGSVGGIFDGVDLTTPEGLRSVMQEIIDTAETLIRVTTGIVNAVAPVVNQFAEWALAGNDLSPTVKELAGEVLGMGTVVNTLAGGIGPLATALNGLSVVMGAGALLSNFDKLSAAATSTTGVLLGKVGLVGAAGAAGFALGQWADQTFGITGALTPLTQAVANYVNGPSAALNKQAEEAGLRIAAQAARTRELTGDSAALVAQQTKQEQALALLVPQWKLLDDTVSLIGGTFQEAADESAKATSATKKATSETAAAIDTLLDSWRAAGGVARDSSLASDLAAKGFKFVKDEVVDLETGLTHTADVFTFAGDSAEEAGDKAAGALSKTAEEALKAQQAANEFQLEWEKIASDERQLVFQLSADIAIAQIEAGTERVKAAFESINTTIESTGSTLVGLAGSLADVGSGSTAGRTILSLLEEENRRRQEALDLQKRLVESQIQYLDAVTSRLQQGDATIQVTAEGLEPELEAFMFKILERIQVRASAEAQQFLLGL